MALAAGFAVALVEGAALGKAEGLLVATDGGAGGAAAAADWSFAVISGVASGVASDVDSELNATASTTAKIVIELTPAAASQSRFWRR